MMVHITVTHESNVHFMQAVVDIPVWNPYPFFGLEGSWPRGFHWSYFDMDSENSETFKTKAQECKPIVQQYLNFNPDFDALYQIANHDFANNSPKGEFKRIVMPLNVFSPYNAKVSII
jgi:hypothetical protein